MDKATIHLELFAKLLRPIITTHIIREKYRSLANQFTHHAIGEIGTISNRQPLNGRFHQRTQQDRLFLLHNSDRLV